MSKSKELIKNTFIVAVGKICTQFVSFILLPFYTIYLSTEEYGIVDLLNTYISLLIPIVFLQTDQAIFRFLIELRSKKKEQEKLITSTIIFLIFQSILYLILYFFVSFFINNEYKMFLAYNVVVTMFANVLLQISRGLGDNKTYSIGCIFSGIGNLVLNIVLIKCFNLGAYGVLIASLVGNSLCILFIFLKQGIYKYLRKSNFDKNVLKPMLKYAIPLVPNMLSWWIINVSDRTIVSVFLGVGINGVYSVANKFSGICISLFNIFNMSWSESASMYVNDDERNNFFSKVINESIVFFSSICISAIAVMPFIFNIFVLGNDYFSAYNQIAILLVATIFNIVVSLLGSIYVALKKSKDIAKTSIYAAIINIVINLLLINKIGLYAASLSTVAAYLSMSIYRFIDINKFVKLKLQVKKMLALMGWGVVVLVSYYFRNIIAEIIILVISVVIFLLLNKNMILSIKNIILSKIKR